MKLFENRRFVFYRSPFLLGRRYVFDRATGRRVRAMPEDLNKLAAVLRAVDRIPLGTNSVTTARSNVLLGFCLAMHGIDDMYGLFMGQDVAVVALTLGTLPVST